MTETPRHYLERDQALAAKQAAEALPADHPERQAVAEHLAYLESPDAYQVYYRTMRGAPCPEEEVFSRHLRIKRFAVIRQRILERRHKTILDLGCLDGWCLLNLAASGISGVGVDLCPEALAVGRERAVKWGFNVGFVEAPIEEVGLFGQSVETFFTGGASAENANLLRFDAVILSEVLEHVLDPLACLKVAAKHLAPNGIVYVSVPATPIPHHGKLEDAREHLRLFTEADLHALAKEAGLAVMVDHEVIPEEDQGLPFSNRTISFRQARIAVYCNHVTGGWRPDRLDEVGGSEEMVAKTAEAWAWQGHAVTVHQNGAENLPGWNGVAYKPRSVAPAMDSDLLVCFKTADHFDMLVPARVFWTTDLPQPGQAASFLPPRVADAVDAVVCISEWHRAELLKACPWLAPAKTKAHWLGVDLEEIRRACEGGDKVPGRMVYASSPDRGLAQLLDTWPRIVKARPDATLHVLYGFDFWIKSEAVLPAPQAEEMRKERGRLEQLLRSLPGVTFYGRLPRAGMLRELADASVWAYPCTGGELCCKTALEAQAARCVPVVVPTMALAETVQVGAKVPLGVFPNALLAALESGDRGIDWALVKTPSWDDLAMFLWAQAEGPIEVRRGEQRRESPIQSPAIALPSDTGVLSPLPERFETPKRVNAPPTGLDILMAVRGMPFDGNTDRERSLGGSETAAIQLSRELVKRGHRVSVFANLPGPPGKFDGVSYLSIQEWQRYAGSTSHDVSIVQREPMGFNQQLQSKVNVLWCHDLGLRRYHAMFRPSLWNVDYVTPVSHWHGQQLCEVYGLRPDIVVPMRNGIEVETIRRACSKGQVRDRRALVYAARPERGLDLLLQSVFPRLLERDPKLTLYVCGYDNTVPEMAAFYEHCQRLITNFGQRAKWMGHLKKQELYGLYSRARLYCYPSHNFEEVACISAMEAAACGLPFVGTTLGALPETTGLAPGFAPLVPHPGHEATEEFVTAFVDAAWKVISDDETNAAMSAAGKAGADAYSWVGVAEEWEDFLIGAIEQRSKDGKRLARHWWRLGDLNGLAQLPAEDLGILDGGQRSMIEQAPPDLPAAVPDHVLQAVAQSALDVKARTIRGLGANGATAAARIAQMTGLACEEDGVADFVFGIETLDCAEDPKAHLVEAERATRPDGHVCMVTAVPGTHQDRLFRGAERRRRWALDNHDIRELLSGKRDLLAVVIGGGGLSAYDQSPLAWALYRWTPRSGPLGTLDLARRRWLQAPRHSLSACMIIRDGESMLHRCLKSIRPYCDEIVVDDNGSTDSTKDILARHGILAGTGPSPLDVGFDEARNVNVGRATGDFILWIDADEELLEGFHLPKYLRPSLFDGFGIAQHHFSAVPQNAFKPDLPVRVFRRRRADGSETGIRFFGVVHEHPETAINHGAGETVILSDVHIAHEGYLTETVRRRRFQRNIPLMFRDRIKYPDRVLGKFLMIRDWCHLARYQLEQNGRQLTPEAAQFLESAIEAYRKDFLGSTHMMAVDGLAYYNEALQHLGRGFEVQVTLKVGGLDGLPHEVAYAGRVASPEDLEKLVTGSARDLTGIWQGKYL